MIDFNISNILKSYMQAAQKLGTKFEDTVHEKLVQSNYFDEVLREKEIIKRYSRSITTCDHAVFFDKYIITIQDKWEESTPIGNLVKSFIKDSRRLAIKSKKQLLYGLYVSKKPFTLNANDVIKTENDDEDEYIFYNITNSTSIDALSDDVVKFIQDKLSA